MKLKAVLIDDLEQARQTLKRDIRDYALDVEVIGEASGVVEGARLLKSVKADVIFLDIQMQDGSGFDLLDILPEIPFKIIFITASDAHAIKAFRYAAIDYLLKPVDPDELQSALDKVRKEQMSEQAKYRLLSESLKTGKQPQRLALHAQDKIDIVEIDDIVRCESQVNYTDFHFMSAKKIVVSRTLKEFEELLTPHGFIRVHQSHLVNSRYIKEFIKTDGGSLLMKNGEEVPVSTRKRSVVLEFLERM